jgi:DNA repair exonuclease SbcCD ATPase subunit
MKITFKKLTWRNFLSTGNNETTIYLDRDSSTLIVGANGAGKSTMLDALSYALFGKPHRSINKPQLVNSINNKNCLVTVEFSVGKIEYKIIRGMKPNIFEVHRNGKLLDQESHSRDYQKIIEQNILKLNHKSFHQVVVLGSSNFIPFMQLPSHQRRNVIEDLLDIGIFTKMNGVLKDKVSLLRSQMNDTDHQLELLKETIRLQNNHIADLKRIDTSQESKRKKEIKRIEDEIFEISNSNKTLQEEYDNTYLDVKSKMDNAHNKIQNHNFAEQSLDTDVRKIVKEAKFYEVNNVCPTCSQDISLDLKNEKIAEAQANAKSIQAKIDKSINERKSVEVLHEEYREQWVHLNEVQSSINTNNVKVTGLKDKIKSLEKVVEVQDTTAAEEKLETDRTTREELNNKRSEQSKVSSYLDAISELLRDTGIKTKVIRQYLPVMNKLINQYLQVLDFFVLFHLDDSFNETIKSRHRDEFTYASFSEGEKQRIDLSLLFAWRQIAKMKNSANTNLLILDETFDSSMDADGVDNLLKILYTLGKETNVFIISHKQDLLEGKFPRKLEFEKVNNFSQLKKDGAL